MAEIDYTKKSASELVADLSRVGMVGSSKFEEIKGALATVLVRDLTGAITQRERTELKLSNRIFWLNIILGAFTVVGTILGAIALFKEFS